MLTEGTTAGSVATRIRLASAGRLARHALEMCVVMCAVAVPLDLGFYSRVR
ncbi:MAG TPA: hypothetical protein VFM93_14000 [Candidatus Limnocylindria bacterium]|nr:hypothetical protein [Candidatus Limnocylindria bacterium]